MLKLCQVTSLIELVSKLSLCFSFTTCAVGASKLGSAMQMLLLLKVLDSKLTNSLLNNWTYVTRLTLALSEYFLQLTLAEVQKSPFSGLIIDLSSDRTSRQNMLVYIIYFDTDSMRAHISNLCCIHLLGKDGKNLFESMKRICDIFGQSLQSKLLTFCADGDGSMQGHMQGVVAHMRKVCDFVISMHCAAHRHLLALSSIAKKYPVLESIDTLLSAVHSLMLRRTKQKAL
jgi:hypothetical protein